MNIDNTILEDAPVRAMTPDRIVRTALVAWKQGDFAEFVNQFNDQFKFTDQALGLEFTKKGRLTEFLVKLSERFPDSERKVNSILSSGNRVVSEWTLTATETQPFLGNRILKLPICIQGISAVLIENGKISEWSDYYDQLKSQRYGIAGWFTEWIEL